jgi:hypothetical protein
VARIATIACSKDNHFIVLAARPDASLVKSNVFSF